MPIIKKLYHLTQAFGLVCGEKLAIIGCGGKTSAMYRLAEENRAHSVLITTTTRILRPSENMFDFEACGCGSELEAKSGITLFYGCTEGEKLLAPVADGLALAQSRFDYALIEADGSKGLPLKGWDEREPVIPEFVTATLAVATVAPVGEILSEHNTHRLPIFLEITGAAAGETVTAAHIAKMLCSPRGMFQKARGRKILLLNQTETEEGYRHALDVVRCMPESVLSGISVIIAGSVKRNEYAVIWEGTDHEPKHSR